MFLQLIDSTVYTLIQYFLTWSATVRWFSPCTPVSSTNNTYHHDIAELLLKVALNSIKQNNHITCLSSRAYMTSVSFVSLDSFVPLTSFCTYISIWNSNWSALNIIWLIIVLHTLIANVTFIWKCVHPKNVMLFFVFNVPNNFWDTVTGIFSLSIFSFV
jgi:hypothetical protein